MAGRVVVPFSLSQDFLFEEGRGHHTRMIVQRHVGMPKGFLRVAARTRLHGLVIVSLSDPLASVPHQSLAYADAHAINSLEFLF